jgi:hydroxylaminobenzene mutase
MEGIASVLSFTGVLLFFAGLVAGFAVPAWRSPRIGLSAHLAGVQSGTFLVAMGILWPHLVLAPVLSTALGHALWTSLYALFASLVLAAAFGAGRGLPIAGGGVTTTPGRQLMVSALLIGGSLVSAGAVATLLLAWHWQMA